MKKILILLLSVAAAVCGAFALAACDDKPTYYKLTLDDGGVIDYLTVNDEEHEVGPYDGASVKSGYEVKFRIVPLGNTTGDPVVTANGVQLIPDPNGYYSFVMKADTTVSVSGVVRNYDVTFDKTYNGDELRIAYYDLEGNELNDEQFAMGSQVKFKVKVSVYYVPEYEVQANTTLLTPDEDGVYTIEEVTGNVTVNVFGLEQEEDFLIRENCGSGDPDDPYLISRPIDLWVLSGMVNSSFYSQFGGYSYKLVDDIDMEGEQLYIIGDGLSGNAYFSGTFDGNSKTISNYHIEDTFIEQSEYTEQFMQYIGLFGIVASTSSQPATITNLHLKNFTITVDDADAYDANVCAGGLIGLGNGANVVGCTAEGRITVAADEGNFAYAGGLIGRQVSYANSAYTARFASGVYSCSTDVEIQCLTGYTYAAGGITGSLISAEERTIAFIVNSFSTGSIAGNVMRAGGIAGEMAESTSVSGCYSVGRIRAFCPIPQQSGVDRIYFEAYAGGIVGYADVNGVIADCFSSSNVSASSINGSSFAFSGGVLGGTAADGTYYSDSRGTLEHNCYYGSDVTLSADFFAKLGWSDKDWVMTEGENPLVNTENTSKDIIVTVRLGNSTINGENFVTASVTDTYIPIAYWYSGIGLDEFLEVSEGVRSYGYYFDAQLTEKVPFSYVPLNNVTLYAGFADYSEVAGRYYVAGMESADSVFFELGLDGSMVMSEGASSLTTSYTYDGEIITLRYTGLASLKYSDEITDSYYLTFLATAADNGTLTIYGTQYYTGVNGDEKLTAYKYNPSFGYGSYETANGDVYKFNKDGTGTAKINTPNGSTEYALSYTLKADGNLNLTLNGANPSVIVTGGIITSINNNAVIRLDDFAGTWEKSATSHKEYTFDGKGNWSYEYYGYANGAKQVIASASGTYKVSGSSAVLYDADDVATGERVSLSDGNLFVANDSYTETYYKQGSLTGVWSYYTTKDTLDLYLFGLGADGYGEAELVYGGVGISLEGRYSAQTIISGSDGTESYYTVITVYVGDSQYALFTFNSGRGTLEGTVYSARYGVFRENAVLFLNDEFKGVWISSSEDFSSLEFNGMGNYDLAGDSVYNHIDYAGSVKIIGSDGRTYTEAYSLDNFTQSGSFTYKDAVYAITYDEAAGIITVEKSGEKVFVTTRDVWYNNSLVDEDGTVYSFDGNGLLDVGGAVVITESNGNVVSAVYFYDPDTKVIDIKLYDGAAYEDYLTITVSETDDCFIRTEVGGGAALKAWFDTPFAGKWLVGGERLASDEVYIEIGKIGPSLTAAGSVFGDAAMFAYDLTTNSLACAWADGTTGVVTRFSLTAMGDELALSVAGSSAGEYTVCIPASAQDGWLGVYTAANGSKIIFDGLGNSKFGLGMVSFVASNGATTAVYYYKIDKNGYPALRSSSSVLILAVPCEADDGAYVGENGKNCKIYARNALYLVTAVDTLTGESYVFDGAETVKRVTADGVIAYKYSIVKAASKIYTVTLTAGDGAVYTVKVDCAAETVALEYVLDKSVTAADGTVYEFTADGTVTARDSEGKLKAEYAYAVTEKNGDVYKVSLVSSDETLSTAIVDFSGNGSIAFLSAEQN